MEFWASSRIGTFQDLNGDTDMTYVTAVYYGTTGFKCLCLLTKNIFKVNTAPGPKSESGVLPQGRQMCKPIILRVVSSFFTLNLQSSN